MPKNKLPARYMTVNQLHGLLTQLIESGEGQSTVLLASDSEWNDFHAVEGVHPDHYFDPEDKRRERQVLHAVDVCEYEGATRDLYECVVISP